MGGEGPLSVYRQVVGERGRAVAQRSVHYKECLGESSSRDLHQTLIVRTNFDVSGDGALKGSFISRFVWSEALACR